MLVRAWVTILLGLSVSCSGAAPEPEQASCAPASEPGIQVGKRQDDEFQPIVDGQEVALQLATQLGLNLPLSLRTVGLETHSEPSAGVKMDLLVGKDPVGTYRSTKVLHQCADDGSEGAIDVVMRISVSRHPDINDVDELEGRDATLSVEVTDLAGTTASVERDVVLSR